MLVMAGYVGMNFSMASIVARIPTALVVSKIGEFSQEMMARVDQCISDQGQEP